MIMTATIMYCYYDDEHEGAGCHTHAVSSFRKQVFDTCTYNIPGTQTTSIFKGRSPPKKQGQNSNQNKGHLGSRYLYMYRL